VVIPSLKRDPGPGPRPGPDPRPGPVRRFVVGTAGHIDHGKTALVKALTGVDTDRWEEEKRRGITIDLGFAPLPLADTVQASIVDVPGHEGFVKNMLAGATGIDVALLVVAADEGPMPQTEEHLAILELLGVQRGIPVIAKADLVDGEWLELVRAELVERLARSRVRWEPPVATSAVSGAGLEELRAALARLATGLVERPVEDLFRLPIDRVFAVAGAGTVVTGSTWSGSVGVGESVRLLPLDREARVRSIEVHGEPTQRAAPGRRTALALVGVDKDELERGHVAVTGTGWAATSVLEATVELLPGAPRPIAARTRLRVHHGTAVVLARAVPAGPIAPGEHGPVRLMLETPLVARGGDRFVLRSFSPVTTIGGGIVLDPFPPRQTGTGRRRQPRLTADQSPAERLQLMAADAGLQGISLSALAVRLGVQPARVTAVIAEAGAGLLTCGDTLAARTAITAEVTRLAEVLRRHHEEHPLDPGMSLQALRAAVVAPAPPPAVIDQILDLGIRKQAWELAGSVARVPGWQPALDARATDARALLARRLETARWQIPTVAELVREFPDAPVRALLAHLIREGEGEGEGGIEQVDQERYATKSALEQFRAALEAALTEVGAATPAVLRDRLGLTRKYLIPLLEWADRRGITRRSGDARTLARLTAGSGGA
jgi:selenocysteine-specific elongation factor